MPTLELVLDATGMQRGAQQAETSLKGVQTAATNTATSVRATSQELSKTFQATQGGVQIATGIAQTAQAFQSLNTAAAGFVGARTLLEIGQTATQLAALRAGAGAASSAFLLLGRAIPYVGLALSVATAAYAIFGGSVKETTQKINEQADALARLQARIGETTIRAGYGQTDPRLSTGGTIDALTALRQADAQRTFSARDAAALFGVSEQDLRYALARTSLGEAALETQPGRYTMRPGDRRQEFRLWNFTSEQVIRAGEDILGQRQRRDAAGQQFSVVPPGSYDPRPFGTPDPYGLRPGGATGRGNYVEITAIQQAQVDAENRAASAERIAAAMERAAQYAEGIGASFGAAAFDVLAGVQGLRQALAQLVGQFARQGLTDLGASVAASLFRPTAAQTGNLGGNSLGSQPT